MRKFLSLNIFRLYFKGIAMGCADLIPGVSGGTIALISGIYEELIETISSINLSLFKLLFTGKIKLFLEKLNILFLLPLLTGIFSSVFLLSGVVKFLLKNFPVLVWSFFSGLLIFSILLMLRHIKKWNYKVILGLVIGFIISITINTFSHLDFPNNNLGIFFSGMIAVCAMILPGISGSFILLILGLYSIIVSAIADLDFNILVFFGLGALIGLIVFSKLINWVLKHYYSITFALLIGFLTGSLSKIWPWKNTLEFRLNHNNELVPLVQKNVMPSDFNGNPQYLWVFLLFALGFFLVFLLDKYSKKID